MQTLQALGYTDDNLATAPVSIVLSTPQDLTPVVVRLASSTMYTGDQGPILFPTQGAGGDISEEE